jgi:hypothetical protein
MFLYSLLVLSLIGPACSLSIVLPKMDKNKIPLLDWKIFLTGPSKAGLPEKSHLSKNIKLFDMDLDNVKTVEPKHESSLAETVRKSYPGIPFIG